MQRSALLCAGRWASIRRTFFQQPPAATLPVRVATLTSSTRTFVQGAPPSHTKEMDKRRKEYLCSSHKDEMEEKYKRRQREIHEYFATHEPNCPEPLEENAFVKGKFGMRRRYYVDHRGKIDAISLGQAIGEGTNAMRK
ncbi:hypothetical protein ABL78_6227 [Leptomonas seymouri]|uniref:Uncharacterized protein n=1 Tax=Leptomonas seymouri TaxID=5684 RepID=A0A0N1I151_LEPSE|nr:hypothetical protein ABL78_6227 [Leptomonas seymouri]|eukprot:KPI84734.1 hypothetical protein ABL78_6227 [Leptomonas seymouri]